MAYRRILALDVGDKRIGVALSDPLGITAQGLETYVRKEDAQKDAAYLAGLAKEKDAKTIVCGLPLMMDGSIGIQAEKVQAFMALLKEKTDCEIVYQDERLTTVLAEKVLIEADMSRAKRRKVVDKMAAVAILQSYLDRK